jgi:glycosyltransferase involved in cell wall biosynthesis
MRIALVASLVSPIRLAEANGPHSIILDLARGLGARGHETVVFAARGSSARGVPIHEIDVSPIARHAAIHLDGTEPSELAKRALAHGFERLFDDVARFAPDAVSQHAFDAPAIRLTEDMPVVHTLHLPPIDPDVVAAAMQTHRALVTVSHAANQAWATAGVHGIRVIRNGVPDYGSWSSTPSNVALIAGRISPEKGTATAIRVARKAGLAPLIAGDIYDRDYFETSVEPELRPGEFMGAVSRRRLSGLMASSAVLLMPVEWEEPFGLVAAEAQMSGCPVVGYLCGALPEIVIEGIGGHLVDSGDEAALTAAVRQARRLDRRIIRQRARRDLGVDRMVAEYEAALLSVGTERRGRAVAQREHVEGRGLYAGHPRGAGRHAGQGNAVDARSAG